MAKIKLLTRKDELHESAVLGLSIRLGRLLPEHVSEMRAMFTTREDSAASIAIYALRHAISELINDGEPMDPVVISYRIDQMDKETKPFLTGIAALVIEATLVSEEVRKKLSSPPAPGGQTNAAQAAPDSADQPSATAATSSSKD